MGIELRVPTIEGFAALKLVAWEDRQAERDLFDLAGLSTRGAFNRQTATIFQRLCGRPPDPGSYDDLPAATRASRHAQLVHQMPELPDPDECLQLVAAPSTPCLPPDPPPAARPSPRDAGGMVAKGHPVVAALYNPLMALQDAAGLRKQRLRATGAATGRVLEVGVGTGWNLRFYRDASEVVGVDPDPHMLRRARRLQRAAPCPVTLVEGDAEDLPFPDDEFDSVLFSLSLCTIAQPTAALTEARRVLRPDGRLVFLEHTRSPRPRTARLQDRVTPVWRRVAGGCHPNRPTVDAIQAAGFELTSVWRSGGGKGVLVQGVARPAA